MNEVLFMKGLFISFEGNDGSGKSSVVKAIYEELEKRGYPLLLSREPGGSKIAEKIRHIILDKDNMGMDDKTESLLYAASRREHLVKTVLPGINEGKIVLCDRYVDSSLAYQGYARHIGIDEVYDMNKYATNGLLPDLTIFVCVRPEVGLARIKKNERDLDRLELETINFHNDVYNGYQLLLEKFPNRIVKVNGEQAPDTVKKDALDIVLKFVEEHYHD